MHITRDFQSKTLSLDQTQSILAFLDDWDITPSGKVYATPMDDQWHYGNEPVTSDPKEIERYRSQCGSLMYFSQCTRPDITCTVNRLCRHLSRPNRNCFRALHRITQYLSTTPHLGIQYHFGTNDTLRLEVYADASYGGEEIDSARSQSGSKIYFGGWPIDWSSSLQSVIAQSSAESEFISAFNASRNAVYFRQLLEELMLIQDGATVIWEDNTACIAMSKNPVNNKRNKHILLKYHYLRDLVESKIIRLEYIQTSDQIADLLTKPVSVRIFQHLVHFLVRPCGTLDHSRSSSSSKPSN